MKYKVLTSQHPYEFEKKLNDAAAQGWKPLSINVIGDTLIATLEREEKE